jgi:hypothetical protein
MPFNSELLPTYSPQEFCRALKSVRERKGITLAEIATATKIPASLFAGLERSDLRRWPKGLFRRSFFRDYVRMIGLPVAETCDEFVRLFPDQEGGALAICTTVQEESNQLNVRLVLDAGWHGPKASVLSRMFAAFVDCGVVLLAAVAGGLAAGTDLPRTTAIVALVYFSLATVVFGESPAKWALSKGQSILGALQEGRSTVQEALRHGADAISGVLGSAESAAQEPVDESHLRVRVKVS